MMALLPLKALVDANTVAVDGLLTFRVLDPDGTVVLVEQHEFSAGASASEVASFLRQKVYLLTLARLTSLVGDHVEEVPRQPRVVSVGGFVPLPSIGTAYDGSPAAKGLGFLEGDFTGATRLRFTVVVNKAGTGVQSWQLWNLTNNNEVAVIDDAGAAGDKILTVTLAGSPSGPKRLRVRAKSSVATDSPTYYGACVNIE